MDYHLQEMEKKIPLMIDPISNDVRMVGIYDLKELVRQPFPKFYIIELSHSS